MRAVLRLGYFHGVRQAAIAEAMNLTPGHVARLMADGMQRLAALIEGAVEADSSVSERIGASSAV